MYFCSLNFDQESNYPYETVVVRKEKYCAVEIPFSMKGLIWNVLTKDTG